jgi:hypothetical protein
MRDGGGMMAGRKTGYAEHGDDQCRGQEIERGTPWRNDVVLPTVGRALVVHHGRQCAR